MREARRCRDSESLDFYDNLHTQIHLWRIGVLPSQFALGTNHKLLHSHFG